MAIICIVIFVINILVHAQAADNQCREYKYDQDSTVCMCDGQYCDSSEPELPPPGQYIAYTSNRDGLRFKKTFSPVEENYKNDANCTENCQCAVSDLIRQRLILKINRTKTYQKMLGFGAAFTDSAGIVTASLNQDMQDKLLRSYFTPSGLDYNMGRVPIGGTDFSIRAYTYDDVEDDPQLLSFALQEEDYKYKIPFILRAKELASEELLLTSTLWSPPLFMKIQKTYVGQNQLKKEYYEPYAQYYIRFLQEYKKNGVEFWSVTPGNEPTDGLYSFVNFTNTCGWLSDDMAKLVIDHFGPALRNSEFNNTKILLLDDSRQADELYLSTLLLYKDLEQYMDGLALHWYFDDYVNAVMLDSVLEANPDLPVFTTEMCTNTGQRKGSWGPAETYARRIIGEMKHRSSAFIDWNYALDTDGGPSWTSDFVDSLIVVEKDKNRFFKQPSYYAFGQFSKYIPRGSYRVDSVETTRSDLDTVAFLRPDGFVAVVLHNSHNHTVLATVEDEEKGVANIELTSKSITTLIY